MKGLRDVAPKAFFCVVTELSDLSVIVELPPSDAVLTGPFFMVPSISTSRFVSFFRIPRIVPIQSFVSQ